MNSDLHTASLKQKLIPRVHIVGRKNCGKTTLLCELVECLTLRGLRIATVKHTHHQHELDTPNKDSYRHRVAGACAVGIVSPGMTAVFVPTNASQHSEEREARYLTLRSAFGDADLVLVEGDLHTAAPRIEVWRAAIAENPYATTEAGLSVVVTDDGLPGDLAASTTVTTISRSNIDLIANQVLEIAGIHPQQKVP